MSTNWTEVLESAERVFAGGAQYLQLPVHVLYTVPPALFTRHVNTPYFLPMIKLRTRAGAAFPPGIAAARALIRKRIPDDILAVILGPDVEPRLEELITWSGGYPRELIRLLQSVVAIPAQPVTEPELLRVRNELYDAYRRMVPTDAFPWLALVAKSHDLNTQNEEHRKVVDLMLSNNAVLRYLNDNEWYDLHPAVIGIAGVQDALRALSQPEKRA